MYLVILSWSLPLSKKCSLAPKGLRSVSLHQGHQESSNTTTAGHSPAERQLKSLSGMSLRATDPKPLNMVFLRAPFSFVPPPCYEAAASSPLHYHIPPTTYFHDPKCPQPYYLLAPGCLHAISFSLSRSRALRYLSYVEEFWKCPKPGKSGEGVKSPLFSIIWSHRDDKKSLGVV